MSQVYHFDRFELRLGERRLLVDGAPAVLGARAFDLLVCLVERRERMVGKDELLLAVWPGLVVEENNLSVQVSALRKLLGPVAISTVAGRGYQFSLQVQERSGLEAPIAPVRQGETPARGASELSAIAVLPFSVLSSEPDTPLLADGLVADVVALLARVPGFLLISRGSTLAYARERTEVADVAKQLSVQYVVEGSVRCQDGQVRVDAQLIDAPSGRILWSGAFRSSRDEAEDLHGGIARGIISHLQPELTRAEIALVRRQRPGNPDAWAHYHEAVGVLGNLGWCEQALREAGEHLQAAVEFDPNFGLAYAYNALLIALAPTTGMVPAPPSLEAQVTRMVDHAVQLDGNSAEVLGYAGCALIDIGRHRPGSELLGQALEIDPSNAQAHVALGAALAIQGELDGGLAEMRLGIRISPRDRRLGFWTYGLANFLLRAGRLDEALQESRRAVMRDPRLYLAFLVQAAALIRLNQVEEASRALANARRLRPALTVEEARVAIGKYSSNALLPLWPDASSANS